MITMQEATQARQAYETASRSRSQRDQEADVFRHVNAALRRAGSAGDLARIRALSDNRRLWLAMNNLMRDPENPLPDETKAGIASIALSVDRELDQESPDFEFLIAMNENIVAALCGHA
jgi:flagellar biosynthesis regulator FlaF